MSHIVSSHFKDPFLPPSSLDLSDHMRNGDYPITRLDAQYDAACMLGGAKLQQNPESSVGVLGEGVCLVRLR